MRLIFILFVFILASNDTQAAAGKRFQEQARAWAAALKAEKQLFQDLACKYELVAINQIEQDLMDLMGQADQELDESTYGSDRAKELAGQIRRLANFLIFKTSSANKLGLEAFVFAREISEG